MLKKFFLLNIFLLMTGCTSNLQNFLTQKELTEIKYGPCQWKFVGTDSIIENPALVIKFPVINDFVLFNQKCENTKNKDEYNMN